MTNRTSGDPWLDAVATPIRGAVTRVAGVVREADERVSHVVDRPRRAALGLYEEHAHRIPTPAVRAVQLVLPPRLTHRGWTPRRDELLMDTITEPILGAVSQVRDVAREADERVSEVVVRTRQEAAERYGNHVDRIPPPAMRVVQLVLPPRLTHRGWTPDTGDNLLMDLLTEPIMGAVSQVREVAREADERVWEVVGRKRREAADLYGSHAHRIPPAALRMVSLMLPPRVADSVLLGGAETRDRAAWAATALRGRPRGRGVTVRRGDRVAPPPLRHHATTSHAPRRSDPAHRAAAAPHTLLIAAPRGFCAGVVRAVEALEMVVEREPAPIYAFHEIVHNRHIVESFEARGVVFIDDLAEVPEGSPVVFSAHGVSPAVVEEAERRQLRVIDSTCPLVTKVHLETKQAATRGYDVLLVGHRGHDETVGTLGEAPDQTRVVEDAGEVAALGEIERPVFVVTQTTLSMDDTAGVIDEIRDRYPAAEIRNDICYATTNRQHAARSIAARADLVLVVGSRNSSNSVRLREVAEDSGATAYLVDGIEDIDPAWYEGVEVVGLTSGASVPDELLDPIIEDLRDRGVTKVEPVVLTEEDVEFRLPDGLAT